MIRDSLKLLHGHVVQQEVLGDEVLANKLFGASLEIGSNSDMLNGLKQDLDALEEVVGMPGNATNSTVWEAIEMLEEAIPKEESKMDVLLSAKVDIPLQGIRQGLQVLLTESMTRKLTLQDECLKRLESSLPFSSSQMSLTPQSVSNTLAVDHTFKIEGLFDMESHYL